MPVAPEPPPDHQPAPPRLLARRLDRTAGVVGVAPGIWALAGAVCLLLMAAHFTTPPWAAGQRQPSDADLLSNSDPLWLWMSQRTNDPQQVLVAIDRETRHAAVYHIDATNGTMTLRSTRNLAWDLLVDDFNGREPSPDALKNMLETGTPAR